MGSIKFLLPVLVVAFLLVLLFGFVIWVIKHFFKVEK